MSNVDLQQVQTTTTSNKLNLVKLKEYVTEQFNHNLLPVLEDFIRIPNLSPNFDKEVLSNGHMEQALSLIVHWIKNQNIKGLNLNVMRIEGKTPLIFIDIDSTIIGKEGWKENVPTVFMYGHADKQPPNTGWAEGLGPYDPVIRTRLPSTFNTSTTDDSNNNTVSNNTDSNTDSNTEDKKDEDLYLYGRGSNDDGYAVFSSILSIKSLQEQSIEHGRIIIVCEFSEESGSCDLPYYLCQILPYNRTEHIRSKMTAEDLSLIPSHCLSDDYKGMIQSCVDLVICLDSGVGNYERIWTTISLRGIFVFELHVSLIREGVHSGGYSGLVSDSFRVIRMLLSRIENEQDGSIKIPELYGTPKEEKDPIHSNLPKWVVEKFKKTVELLGYSGVCESVPLLNSSVELMNQDLLELLLNKTWRPTLTITGANGLPPIETAGNVLRPLTALKCSIRLPPHVTPNEQLEQLVLNELIRNPPYNAQVQIKNIHTGSGWCCSEFDEWLTNSLNESSREFFNVDEIGCLGEGGTIPFMKVLNDCYPQAQMLITGVAGPGSNAHGPNEHLNLNYTKKIICSVAKLLNDHSIVNKKK
ncbi:predicted protein [Naegleria gruberi]|uniref:Predicted protein n=1 Tax=Naegleria gruberi TaxID=5762 RepID=D2UX87_NAEGR|nr:uncharacterized protein NAEGRDRAFT_61675 [Naegleria gruberi]EFC50587.1 predicted protein [Naegleria gruberi]|eukprot:XP_002683331.1 predicted protein [Naegleria gruberi strain NEG-M]